MEMMSDRFPVDRETRYYNQVRLKEEAAIGIYNLMEENYVNRAELARIIGKSRSYITKVLEGSHNFTLETLADVYAALGRAVHLSLGDDVREFCVPSDERKVETTYHTYTRGAPPPRCVTFSNSIDLSFAASPEFALQSGGAS